MKFLAATLAFVIAVASAVKNDGGSARRLLDKHKIMQNAVRVDRNGKRLLDQQFELTSVYSLQFNKCLSLTLEPGNEDIIFSENLISYTSKGAIVAQKSYILFNVCETRYCDYYAADDNLFMIDVETYMSAITEFYEDHLDQYCQACKNSYGYCG